MVSVADAYHAHTMARRALHLWQRLTATRIGMQDAEDHGAEHLYKRQLLVGFVALKAFVVPKNPNRRYRTPRYYPIPTHSHARSANARVLQTTTASAMSREHSTYHSVASSRVETGNVHVAANWTPAPASAYRMQRSVVTTPSFNPVTYARGQLSAQAHEVIQHHHQAIGPSTSDHARASASAAIAHSMQARTYDGSAQMGPRGRSATPWDDEDDPKRIKVSD